MRWRLRLAEITFVMHHKKLYVNTQADALSRLPSKGHTTVEEDHEIPCYILPLGVEKELPEQITVAKML